MSNTADNLLEVEDLRVHFLTGGPPARAVDGVSFSIGAGETVALVGESGCGKSVTALALARLVPSPPGIMTAAGLQVEGRDVLRMSDAELRRLRGGRIAYVFQEPGMALNPVFCVGGQIAEALRLHSPSLRRSCGEKRRRDELRRSSAWLYRPDVSFRDECLRLLRLVGLPDPERRLRAYPHELSGGMQQRVMIAIALACRPALLVADEPTTALDVTIQAQIMALLTSLQRELGMAMLLITHNLGLVAGVARRMHVMYAGRIVESGPTEKVLGNPRHPYTRGLLDAVPSLDGGADSLRGIPGSVPSASHLPTGCRFHPRCPQCREICREKEPELAETGPGQSARCWLASELQAKNH